MNTLLIAIIVSGVVGLLLSEIILRFSGRESAKQCLDKHNGNYDLAIKGADRDIKIAINMFALAMANGVALIISTILIIVLNIPALTY